MKPPSTNKPHRCAACGKRFVSEYARRQHVRTLATKDVDHGHLAAEIREEIAA